MSDPVSSRTQIVRPGAEPTHNDAESGKCWHYLHLDGSKMDPPTSIEAIGRGGMWFAQGFKIRSGGVMYPEDGLVKEEIDSNRAQILIEADLKTRGFDVISPPEWWAEAQMVRAAIPERAHLIGPIEGNAHTERWVVCEDAAGAEPIGFLSPTPIEALKTAFDVLQDNVALYRAKEKTTDAALNTIYSMLREAGYSPDPAGLGDALTAAKRGNRTATGKLPAAMANKEPSPITVDIGDGTMVTLRGGGVVTVAPDEIRIKR